MGEMLELLNIQHTEYWETVKDDKEAVAYYESAFKEMAMRDIEAHYGCTKRLANTVGSKLLVMHPADLAMQYSYRLKIQMMGSFSSANIDNPENRERVEKLFAENNKDGRFAFDAEDFTRLSAFMSTASWKLGNSGNIIYKAAAGDYSPDDESDGGDFADAEKKILGKAGIGQKNQRIKKDLQKSLNTLKEKLDTLKDRGAAEKEIRATEKEIRDIEKDLKVIDGCGVGYYWALKHPERYNQKTFLSKGSNGKFLFGQQFRLNGRAVYRTAAAELKDILDNNVLAPLDEKELKAYEASLKERKMPAYMIEGDVYGIDLYRKKMDALIVRDENGNIVKENGKVKLKSIQSLPGVDSVTGEPVEDLLI